MVELKKSFLSAETVLLTSYPTCLRNYVLDSLDSKYKCNIYVQIPCWKRGMASQEKFDPGIEWKSFNLDRWYLKP